MRLAASLCVLLMGCPEPDTGTACTEIAASSVTLYVENPDGQPDDGTVTWSLDGVEQGECYRVVTGTYTCGTEQAGTIVVTVAAAGFAVVTHEVVVIADECHVDTQVVNVTLTECGNVSYAGLVIDLSASDGAAVTAAKVDYRTLDTDMASWVPCAENAGRWFCAWDEYGNFEAKASLEGYADALGSATVPLSEDGCHSDPQTVALILEPE